LQHYLGGFPSVDGLGVEFNDVAHHELPAALRGSAKQRRPFISGAGHPRPCAKNSYRGAAAGDFNNDGRIDLVLLPVDGPALLHENSTEPKNNWIGLRLRGVQSNREADGAFVRVEGCGHTWFDTVRNGGGYLSHDDPRLHFGLGNCQALKRIVVRWPAGSQQAHEQPPVNGYLPVVECEQKSAF
jgi:hypothetical protein